MASFTILIGLAFLGVGLGTILVLLVVGSKRSAIGVDPPASDSEANWTAADRAGLDAAPRPSSDNPFAAPSTDTAPAGMPPGGYTTREGLSPVQAVLLFLGVFAVLSPIVVLAIYFFLWGI
jgi:hypothetical protein